MFVGLNHGTGTKIRASCPESKGIMVNIKLAKPSEVRDLTRTVDLRLLSNLILGTMTKGPVVPKVRDCIMSKLYIMNVVVMVICTE